VLVVCRQTCAPIRTDSHYHRMFYPNFHTNRSFRDFNFCARWDPSLKGVNDRPRQLQIRTERGTDDQVRLTVQDAGVGLDPQAMDRLFQAFYTTKNDGMGIGLSVSRSIIERHHGRLWAEPNDGPGATFSFSIPRQGGAPDAG